MKLKVSRFYTPNRRRPPWIGSAATSLPNGTYGTGSVLPLKVVFSEPVTVTGTPHLALNTGATAFYTSGSGTTTLIFRYTVGAGDTSADLNYAGPNALTLFDGTITTVSDSVPANLTLPPVDDPHSLGGEKDIVIDTITTDLPYVLFTGHVGCFASTPDSAAVSVVGDIDVRLLLSMDDWTPAGFQYLMAEYAAAAGNNSWWFGVANTASPVAYQLTVVVSADGTNTNTALSDVPPGFANATRHHLRWTRDVDDGAGHHVDAWYTSADYDPAVPSSGTWTPIGSQQSAAPATSIADTPAGLTVAASATGTNRLVGRVYRAQLLNGIGGTLVADFNPADSGGLSQWTSTTTGEVWNLNGDASVVGAGAGPPPPELPDLIVTSGDWQ